MYFCLSSQEQVWEQVGIGHQNLLHRWFIIFILLNFQELFFYPRRTKCPPLGCAMCRNQSFTKTSLLSPVCLALSVCVGQLYWGLTVPCTAQVRLSQCLVLCTCRLDFIISHTEHNIKYVFLRKENSQLLCAGTSQMSKSVTKF